MKRWMILVFAILLFAAAVYFYLPYLNQIETKQIISLSLLVGGLLFSMVALYAILSYRNRAKIATLQNRLSMWTKLSYHVNQVGDEVFNQLPISIIAFDDDLEIKWANPHAKKVFDSKITGKDLLAVHEDLDKAAKEGIESFNMTYKDRSYDVTYRAEFKFFYVFDVTEREAIKKRYNESIPALGIIYLDNLDEALASMDVSFQSTLKGDYLAAISDWINKYDGFLKPYGDERLLFVTYRKQLDQMIMDKFDILDKIRVISTQNQVRVSLSMGVASWDIDYEDLGVLTQNAIELAEKRGGDQVVVNIQHQKIAYFGAKIDASAKSSRVSIRINAQTIKDYIQQAESIFVMTHDQADLDAFGSMIAVYHMAKAAGKPSYMLMEPTKVDLTVSKVLNELMAENPTIMDAMITENVAMSFFNDDSLLIITDCQSPKLVMSKPLLNQAKKQIVIDHHRISDERFNALFSIIEPYASSTIELIMELLSFYAADEGIAISPIEATIMYGGLVVDTNNFTYRTGSRTFEVASRLRELGADILQVKRWLRKDLIRTLEINNLLNQVEIYLDRFAIVTTPNIYEERVLLAQVAEALLQINGVEAAFMISRITDNKVGVSARSYQNVNVQVLMEALGGGGHLNSAAAQIEDKSIQDVYEMLKTNIELEYGIGGEPMKIILLEDIKGRGKKDEMVDVAPGFAQYLITSKKAMQATEENIQALNKAKADEKLALERHIELMKKLKSEIDNKKVTLSIQIGHDGKLFGSVTTKQIVEAFEKDHHITIDKKKVELSSDINSVGIYSATVQLHKDIKAQFEVHIIEK